MKQALRKFARELPYVALRFGEEVGLDFANLFFESFLDVDLRKHIEKKRVPHNPIPYGLDRGIPFGIAGKWRNQRVHFPTDNPDAFCRHKIVLGATRMGKTTWAKLLCLELAKAGYGFAYLDNADGEAVDELRDALPLNCLERTIILDYGNKQWPIPLPMASKANDIFIQDMLTAQWISFFEDNFGIGDQWRTKDLISYACRAVFEDPDNTLLEVVLMASNPSFRRSTMLKIKDPEVRAWWQHFESLSDGMQNEIIASFMNKSRALLSRRILKHIIGQRPKYDISGNPLMNYRRWMDEGKIVLIKAPESMGRLAVRVIMALNMIKFWSAALSRDDTPKDRRKPFFIFADEPQTWLSKNEQVLDDIFSKAGKYRLGITCLFQSTEQIKRESPALLRVMLANKPDLILFATDQEEVKHFARDIVPYTAEQVSNLPRFSFIARINGYEPFHAKNLGKFPKGKSREAFAEECSRIYGRPIQEVSDDIAQRMFGHQEGRSWSALRKIG